MALQKNTWIIRESHLKSKDDNAYKKRKDSYFVKDRDEFRIDVN